jgi:DNA-binding XRE family transcriptional regulator
VSDIEDDDEITINFTVTKEYAHTEDLVSMAKTLGVSKTKLRKIVEDGEDYEPSDKVTVALVAMAECTSDEMVVDSIEQA